ncbi:MAG: dihydroneopterin aldolase [Actinobacteria bacterium]|jgi:7,8-dihydroneopterin aldolase/epimerase/oxygenase|nr:dihydroneopterin aldolase [Actinomycetota bacterium]
MTDTIEIRGLRCSVIVGILPEERLREQPLTFDIDIMRSFATAALNDDIHATSNYAAVIDLVLRLASTGKFQLLETLVYRAAQEIMNFDSEIAGVTVTVRKLRPPVPQDVDTVGVRCTLDR